MDYFERINEIETALDGLSGGEVFRLFTQYHGCQLLDEGFREHLVEEGIIPEEEE